MHVLYVHATIGPHLGVNPALCTGALELKRTPR
jgi:hypothetical protein